jgi:hypothetical protein
MKNIKLLITAGCSFTQYPNKDISWSYHLSEHMGCETLYLGQGAAGNGIISRHVIFQTLEALKKYKPNEILVGIMWSGANRHEFYHTETVPHHSIIMGSDKHRNPIKINKEHNFYILNNHWDDESTQTYFKYFHNEVGSYISTIEHILRVQWFLKLHNIPYFMTKYARDVLPESQQNIWMQDHSDIRYLYNQIDFSNFLNVNNCLDWARDESGFDFARPPDPHPSTEQHKAFTERIIIPHLTLNTFNKSSNMLN